MYNLWSEWVAEGVALDPQDYYPPYFKFHKQKDIIVKVKKIYGILILFHSFISGPSTTVYYCDAANPGSFHDNYVLKNSPIYQKYERGELPFEGACVLGDSGYENCREWLITPFPGNLC